MLVRDPRRRDDPRRPLRWDLGFISNVSFSPQGGLGAIVLLNGIGPASKLARTLIETVLPALREAEDRREADAPTEPTPEAFRELLGVYRDPELEEDIVIEWRDERLVLIGGADQEGRLHELEPAADPLVFTMRGGRPGGEPIVFLRGPDGRIEACNAAGYPAIRVGLVRAPFPR